MLVVYALTTKDRNKRESVIVGVGGGGAVGRGEKERRMGVIKERKLEKEVCLKLSGNSFMCLHFKLFFF